MRPTDLKSSTVLGEKRPHGHKMRYMAGCRCVLCRKANSEYERKMRRDRELFGPNDVVSTELVRKHLKRLQRAGLGHKRVAKLARVGKTTLSKILWYGKNGMRRRAANRVLAIQANTNTLPKGALVEATPTLRMIDKLMKEGFSKRRINREALGNNSDGLQIRALKISGAMVQCKTAVAIRKFYRTVMY